MASQESIELFSIRYQQMLREDRLAKGISIADISVNEIFKYGSRVKGNKYCEQYKCKCQNVSSCDITHKTVNFNNLHGDASYGEIGISDPRSKSRSKSIKNYISNIGKK